MLLSSNKCLENIPADGASSSDVFHGRTLSVQSDDLSPESLNSGLLNVSIL